MKKVIIFSLILSVVLTSACSKDAEVAEFIKELDAATFEIVSKIDANPSTTGVDEAQKSFDARKPQLTAKWDQIRNAAGVQVSGDTKKRLEDSIRSNMKSLTDVSIRNMMKMAADKEATVKFQRLLSDYTGTFQATPK